MVMHEAGHGMYEQGVDDEHQRTLLEGGASLGLHESQSRLWENMVGRSRAFWRHFFPLLKAQCPSQLAGVEVEDHRGVPLDPQLGTGLDHVGDLPVGPLLA